MNKFTIPKIYHGGKSYDLKKRWYVYFSYIHPETGEMKRQNPITFSVNKNFKTKTERLRELKIIRDRLEKLLKQGYSPYSNEV